MTKTMTKIDTDTDTDTDMTTHFPTDADVQAYVAKAQAMRARVLRGMAADSWAAVKALFAARPKPAHA